MKKLGLFVLFAALFIPHARAQGSLERCQSGACYGFGAPTGVAQNGFIYQDVSQTPPALYCPKNGAWVACGGSGSGSVVYGTTANTATQGNDPRVTSSRLGMLAEYNFSAGSGTTVADLSGNGNNATFTASGGPAWSNGGLTFTNGATAQLLQLPTALNTARWVQITVQLGAMLGGGSYPSFVGHTAQNGVSINLSNNYNNDQYGFGPNATTGFVGYSINGASGLANRNSSTQAVAPGQIVTFTLDLNASANHLYVNANEVPNYNLQPASVTLPVTGNYVIGGNPGGCPTAAVCVANATILHAVFYSSEPTAQNIANNVAASAAFAATNGALAPLPSTSTANVLFCEGDSLTQPQGATNSNCSAANLGALTDAYTIVNPAIGCSTPAAALARGAYVDSFYHPNALHNVLVYNLGTNAEASSTGCFLTEAGNLALAEAHIASYIQARRAAGWKVVLVGLGSRGGETAFKNNLNLWERANWNGVADRFVDVGSDPLVGCDTCSTNTTYFQSDQTHWTDTTETRVGGYIAAAVNSLNAAASAVPVTYATNHTILASEPILRGDSTAAQVVLTIPVSTAKTGSTVEVKNITSSGVNLLEVQASGIDTIDGGTCISIPQGSTVKFRSVVTSISAATSQWENFNGGAYGASCGGGGGGTIAKVGDATSFSATAVTTWTQNYSCTVGNLVHVATTIFSIATTAGISSSPSATWTAEYTTMPVRTNPNDVSMQVWDSTCPATGSQAITVTSSVSAGIWIAVSELQGTSPAKFDHVASGTGGGSSTAVALSTTATLNNSAAIVDVNTGAPIVPGNFAGLTAGYTAKASNINNQTGWQSTTISSGAVSFGVNFGGSATQWLGSISIFHP